MTKYERAVRKELAKRYSEAGYPPNYYWIDKITKTLCDSKYAALSSKELVNWYFSVISK